MRSSDEGKMSHIWLSESGKASRKIYESKAKEIREKVFVEKELSKKRWR